VTKVGEGSVVPRVGPRELALLAQALDRPGVVAAWVFGSQAAGRPGPLSDIDVGLWLDPALDAQARLDLRLELGDAAARALGTDEIDVVVLNDAPPLLQHRAMHPRLVAVERDRDARVRLETRALLEYLDTAPLRRLADQALRRRLREGTYGRP